MLFLTFSSSSIPFFVTEMRHTRQDMAYYSSSSSSTHEVGTKSEE
jgi:hypothetical protein